MLDTGLLLSGVVMIGAMWFAARLLRLPESPSATLDWLVTPGIVGLLAGRAAALVLDDPTSLGSLRSFLVIRGGAELWPGAVVAAGVLAVSLRRAREPVIGTMARLAPIVLIGYAAYEATCVLREGCYGPVSPLGLRPDGLSTRMLPAGVVVALSLGVVAVLLVRRLSDAPVASLLLAIAAVGGARSLSSVWLPRLGDELTRPHRESIGVLATAVAGLLVLRLVHRSAVR